MAGKGNMRFREFLIEYSRAKTAEMVGNKLILALADDHSIDLPRPVFAARNTVRRFRLHERNRPGAKTVQDAISAAINKMMTPEERATLTDQILAAIEEKDPTPNKAYTPWLARMYANGFVSIEDINRDNLLSLYDTAKKRRMLKPEHNDINSFKHYINFEYTMENVYDNLLGAEQEPEDKGQAKKVYEDSNVTVIVPQDEAAACRYGRGTRWCTAATRGQNYFDMYNKKGPLYILIPKHPEHPNEKYQLHFSTEQYMDENDNQVDLTYILKQRFPELLELFKRIAPEIKDDIRFVDTETIQQLLDDVKEAGELYIGAILNTSEDRGETLLRNGDIDALKQVLNVTTADIEEYEKTRGGWNRRRFGTADLPYIMKSIALGDDQNKSDFVNNWIWGIYHRMEKIDGAWVLGR